MSNWRCPHCGHAIPLGILRSIIVPQYSQGRGSRNAMVCMSFSLTAEDAKNRGIWDVRKRRATAKKNYHGFHGYARIRMEKSRLRNFGSGNSEANSNSKGQRHRHGFHGCARIWMERKAISKLQNCRSAELKGKATADFLRQIQALRMTQPSWGKRRAPALGLCLSITQSPDYPITRCLTGGSPCLRRQHGPWDNTLWLSSQWNRCTDRCDPDRGGRGSALSRPIP
jgi:hypothetical protein